MGDENPDHEWITNDEEPERADAPPGPPPPPFVRGGRGYVLEGDVLVPVPHTGGGRRFEYDEDFITSVVEDRISGMTLAAVANKYGISIETVRRWSGEARNAHRLTSNEDVINVRAKVALRLEVLAQQALKVMRGAMEAGNGKLALESIASVRDLDRTRATLLGLNAAVKIDATVTEVTQADIEFRELVNEYKARAEAQRAQVEANFKARQGDGDAK